MANKLHPRDLQVMASEARRRWIEFQHGAKLLGMDRPLSEDEVRALCWYEAALAILNKQGGVQPGWLEENPVTIEFADSDPMSEDQDYEDVEEDPQ